MRGLIALISGLVVVAGAAVIASDIIEIRIRGHYFSEPATVQITIAVEPDAANRVLRIEADGDREYRSTEVELQGLDDKRIHTIEFKNLPAGSYELRAEVLSKDRIRGTATSDLVVAGGTVGP